MVKRVWFSLFLVLMIVVVPVSHPALARDNSSPNMQKTTGFSAYFSQWDPSGCIRTYVYLDVSSMVNKNYGPHNPPYELILLIAGQWDACQGQQLLSGFIWGMTPNLTFEISPSLRQSEAVLDTQIYDLISNSMVSVSFDLTWLADGRRSIYQEQSKSEQWGCVVITRAGSVTVPAALRGQISLNGTVLDSGQASEIYLYQDTLHEVRPNCSPSG